MTAYDALALADGRVLDVLLGGVENATALVMHHGTPSDASLWEPWSDACREAGLRLVAISRPGYGHSSRKRGRCIADVAADVRAVLDVYRIDAFVTAGWSGGGPHALACAALLAPRCKAAATFAGVGAYGVADLDFLAGMGPENHEEFAAALEGETALRAWLAANAEPFRDVTGDALAAAFGGLVSPVDVAALSGGFADAAAATMRRALDGGFDGWIDDDLAFIAPWGFDLASISVPVTIWQGDADLMVPRAHGDWLARHMPHARHAYVPGEGHISLLTNRRATMLEELRAAG
jgi:pimeloyl-ACP methyl ester carboxylesterase